jgi:hypothetical protein
LSVLLSGVVSVAAYAQETVFNVPSADLLDNGKTYFEWDAVMGDAAPSAALTPRMVRGIGHNAEAGFNVSSFNMPQSGTVAFVSTLKWKFYENRSHDLCLFAGNDVYTPIRHRTYKLGDSFYVEAAKTFKTGTRVGVGTYDYTSGVIDRANRAGAVASVEQAVSRKLGVAADWYSGNNAMGYVTPGVSYKVGNQLTAFAAYQIGNHDLSQGNHSVLLILGWNPTWGLTGGQ